MKISEQLRMFVKNHQWLADEMLHADTLPEPWRTKKLRELQMRAAQLQREHHDFLVRYGGAR